MLHRIFWNVISMPTKKLLLDPLSTIQFNYGKMIHNLSASNKITSFTEFHFGMRNFNGCSHGALLMLNPSLQMNQIRTFKDKMVLRRRCRDCYFTVIDGRRYVLCKTFGRHKQRQILPREKNTWILTHATQGIRKW